MPRRHDFARQAAAVFSSVIEIDTAVTGEVIITVY